MSSRLLPLAAVLSMLLSTVLAVGKTHIYIDQVPLYTDLAPCAQNRLEAIVRNQFSGCGDDQQLTSFACFCINSSTEFSSIISTAVVQECSRAATQTRTQSVTGSNVLNARAVETGGAEARRRVVRRQEGAVQTQLASAMEVWESYCAKSTELSRFGATPSVSQGTPATITPGPQTVTVAPATAAGTVNVPIAAIVVPTVLIPLLAIAGALAFVWYMRKKAARSRVAELDASEKNRDEKNSQPFTDPVGDRNEVNGVNGVEVPGSAVYYEMEHRSYQAELQSGPKDVNNARTT